MKQKQPREERIIKGQVEGYSRDITSFPGGRGSRGMKVEGEWHNMIGSKDFLELLEESFAPDSFVVFAEKQNKKGYWDFIEGTLKKITKQEAYSNEIQDEIPQEKQITTEEKLKKLQEDSNFKHAPGYTEEEVRELTADDIALFRKENRISLSEIAQKEHQIVKLTHNEINIQKSLGYAISTQKNIILSAKGIMADLEYDLENEVTLLGTKNKIEEIKEEISRLNKNIQARELDIEAASAKSRDEKARVEVKKKYQK